MKRRIAAATALLASSAMLSGCVAALAPLAAATAMGGKQVFAKKGKRAGPLTPPQEQTSAVVADSALPAVAPVPAPPSTAVAPAGIPASSPAARPSSATEDSVPPGMQYLYGSGEAAAASIQAYQGLVDMIIARASDRGVGMKVWSSVLAPTGTLAAPQWTACENKPLAVILDIDETSVLNLGYEADDAQHPGRPYDQARWDRWETSGANAIAAVPGLVEAAKIAAASKVKLIYNSNRSAANAAATEAALTNAGLGPVKHLDNLWLQGDVGGGAGKDARRWAIAEKYCVIAMVGDQLGDFSDQFNAPGMTPAVRRAAVNGTAIHNIWGHGWFVLPNPVYGTALKGRRDEVFPADKRWTDPGAGPQALVVPQ